MKLKMNDRIRNIISICLPLVALVFGMFMFLSRYAYAEDGHNVLLTIYVIACFAFIFALRKMSLIAIIVVLVVAGSVQAYAAMKFNWRQDYIESAMAGQPFPLEEMIETYPTYEEHLFAFLKKPDWVGFNKDCVQPALTDGALQPDCTAPDLISNRYRIDVIAAMQTHLFKMQYTAKQLEEGKMQKRSEYLECITARTCATIPLLPKGVDASTLDPMSKDYIGIRQAFWSLVNDKKMSVEACALTDICKALVKMGVVNPEAMPF